MGVLGAVTRARPRHRGRVGGAVRALSGLLVGGLQLEGLNASLPMAMALLVLLVPLALLARPVPSSR